MWHPQSDEQLGERPIGPTPSWLFPWVFPGIIIAAMLAGTLWMIREQRSEPLVIAGAIRPTDEGWVLIRDGMHAPRGIASVAGSGDEATIHFEHTASRVITFVASSDESALNVGASVGLDHAVLTISPMPEGEWANVWVYGLLEP